MITILSPEVQAFAAEMQKKLNKNQNSKGFSWQDMTIVEIINRIDEEVDEVRKACRESKFQKLTPECADVANFCLFMAVNHGELMK